MRKFYYNYVALTAMAAAALAGCATVKKPAYDTLIAISSTPALRVPPCTIKG